MLQGMRLLHCTSSLRHAIETKMGLRRKEEGFGLPRARCHWRIFWKKP
jgi:hypothetical protein